MTLGGGYNNLQEPSGPTILHSYKQTWERGYLDLTELARLRWVDGWKIERLADYFDSSATAIKERLRSIKKNPMRAGVLIEG